MGINDGPPDEDSLMQIFLFTEHINSVLSGTNHSHSDIVLDYAAIDQLQARCFNTGQAVILSFGVNANKKLHKLMSHILNTIKGNGSNIWSTNELNESMHKDKNDAFSNTNKRQHLLHE